MSLEFLKNENYSASAASMGRSDLWYGIDYPTAHYVDADNAQVIEPKWIATRYAANPATFPVILGHFNSQEEAVAACNADLTSNPPQAK